MTDKPLSGKIRGEINGGGFSWGVWGQARPDIMGGRNSQNIILSFQIQDLLSIE